MTAYRYVRLGRLAATKEGNTWVVDEDDLTAFSEESTEPRSRSDWAEELERVMVAGDPAAAWAIIEQALASSFEPAEVHTDLLLPAMRSIGSRWAAGEIGVAEEHLATAVARRCVSRLSPRFNRRGRSRGSVVVALGPGERHQLGAEILADLLRGENFDVLYLGEDTPPDAVALAAERADHLVAVCVAAFRSAESLRLVAGAVRGRVPGVPVIFGGPVVSAVSDAKALGGDHLGATIPEAVELIDRLAG